MAYDGTKEPILSFIADKRLVRYCFKGDELHNFIRLYEQSGIIYGTQENLQRFG